VGWRVKDMKVEARWGVYGREDMGGFRESDDVARWIDSKWDRMKAGGTVSMTFLPIESHVVQENGHRVREITRIHHQSTGFVKEFAASPGAVTTDVPQVKGLVMVLKAVDLPPVSRETAPVPAHIHASAEAGGGVETLKVGSRYAPSGSTEMVTDEDAAKLTEDAKEAKAKVKELEAELAEQKEKAALAEKQPPEGGCPEGKEWDPDAGECVDKEDMSAHEEDAISRKEFDELKALVAGNRDIGKRLLKQNMPGPEDQLKSLRDGIAAALTAGTITEEVSTSMLGIAEAAFPTPETPLDERAKGLVQGVVDAKMAEVKALQTEAFDTFEKTFLEKMGMGQPIDESRVKPAATGAGTGGLTLEKAAGDFMEKVSGSNIPKRTGVRGGL
ncbi:MAG: hypothetical protein V3U45_03000, partial [bacterium]